MLGFSFQKMLYVLLRCEIIALLTLSLGHMIILMMCALLLFSSARVDAQQGADSAMSISTVNSTIAKVPLVRMEGGMKWGMGMRMLGRRRCGSYFAILGNPNARGGVLFAVSDTLESEDEGTAIILISRRKILVTERTDSLPSVGSVKMGPKGPELAHIELAPREYKSASKCIGENSNPGQ